MDYSGAIRLKSSKDQIEIENHFKLCAGPGAGKTTFLINHIHSILRKSKRLSKTRKIACITYTNVGVETIRSRLKDVSNYVEVATIHSFLYKHVVKPYLWILKDIEFPLDKLEGHDEVKLGYKLLEEYREQSGQTWIKNNRQLSEALVKLTWVLNDRENLELKFLSPFHGKVKSIKGKEIHLKKDSYMIYKKICWKEGLMSHDDVLYFSYLILKRSDRVKTILRAKFPYFLVDEFQDTNPIQVAILKLIAEKETVVGVIGDPCQSIFSFQGADKDTFDRFSLDGMKSYILENNHRSTKQIISLLNFLRNDNNFVQSSPDGKSGRKPILLVGERYSAVQLFTSECNQKEWCILSYRNDVINPLKYNDTNFVSDEIDLSARDKERGECISHIIYALEHGRQMNLKEAIKFMKKAFKSVGQYSDKEAIRDIKRLLDDYDKIRSMNIKDFYNSYIFNQHGVKKRFSCIKKKKLYEKLSYTKAVSIVNIIDDKSRFRTIHKAKGDEFDNVLVIVPKNQDFLFKPDMSKEEHRVYYVALSRAREQLYVNIRQHFL